eukprot:SAG31_NODE_5046_length_2778_cov_4.430758_5_plen_56_part_01
MYHAPPLVELEIAKIAQIAEIARIARIVTVAHVAPIAGICNFFRRTCGRTTSWIAT